MRDSSKSSVLDLTISFCSKHLLERLFQNYPPRHGSGSRMSSVHQPHVLGEYRALAQEVMAYSDGGCGEAEMWSQWADVSLGVR